MKLFVTLFALVAVAAAQLSNEYLPPNYGGDIDPSGIPYSVGASTPAVSYETAASIPAHSYSADDGYRYKTQRRRVVKTSRRHRREVNTEYLPPAASAPSGAYLAPAASYSEPAASYGFEATAPVASYESYETAGSIPSASYSGAEGYRYKTNRRRVVKTARRHRREVSTEYLPPAASAPSGAYLAPAASYSEPAASYDFEATAPVASYESYETAGSIPSASYSGAEGYRYKTNRRRVVKTARRHRREVSTEYLPPAASAPSGAYLAPAASYSEPAASYGFEATAPVASYESYETAGSIPSASYSGAEGYRYKTNRRRVVKTARRHRREVSTEYLPPAASAPSGAYLAPAASYSEPAASYGFEATAPVASYESYETAASIPSASYSGAEGYRYKTNRRRVVKTARRHRREVSSEYLPPAASAPSGAYLAPAASYSEPASSYGFEASGPVASYESYETAGSVPSASFSGAEGYRYKTNRRRVVKTARRHRREVSSEYLPPAASAPAATYAEPAASYSSASYSTPAGSYSVESSAPGGVQESYETAAAAPAHSFSDTDGYRYKTVRRRVIRRHR